MKQSSALIVEDDQDFREALEVLIGREGFEALGVNTVEAARAELDKGYDVILVDRHLPDGDGLSLLEERELLKGAEVVVITGDADLESAVAALRLGVLDYLTKPLDRARLKSTLSNVKRTRALKAEVNSLRGNLRDLGRFGSIVGRSPVMQEVFDMISRVAPTDASVLITGESGTGKEVVARTIHELSERRDNALEAVNCGAIPESLIESELFGHEKGSFTGAEKTRQGFFERADGGTLFLDEITEMPIELQVKLLRVLETGLVQRVGGAKPTAVDVRVLAATNRDPLGAVSNGKLRQDLYYRLAVFPIALPPLRERGEDVELLAHHFLAQLNDQYELEKKWSDEALAELAQMPWEGNVRELRNAVHRAYIMAEEVLAPSGAAKSTSATAPAAAPGAESDGSAIRVEVGESVADAERKLILATLEKLDGDKPKASEILGISLKTLYSRLKVYKALETKGS